MEWCATQERSGVGGRSWAANEYDRACGRRVGAEGDRRPRIARALGSLKDIIEKNRGVNQWPELFCFGLLQEFDVKQLTALVAPWPVVVVKADERACMDWPS